MRRYLLSLAAGVLATAAVPAVAAAADAVTTTEVNMRAGPDTTFPVVQLVPENAAVTVYSCISDYDWCDVSWRDARGWIAGAYLSALSNGSSVPFVEYAPTVSLPIEDFVFDTYWDTYYRSRPWYGRRTHWRQVWGTHRNDARRHARSVQRLQRVRQRREATAARRATGGVQQRTVRTQRRAARTMIRTQRGRAVVRSAPRRQARAAHRAPSRAARSAGRVQSRASHGPRGGGRAARGGGGHKRGR